MPRAHAGHIPTSYSLFFKPIASVAIWWSESYLSSAISKIINQNNIFRSQCYESDQLILCSNDNKNGTCPATGKCVELDYCKVGLGFNILSWDDHSSGPEWVCIFHKIFFIFIILKYYFRIKQENYCSEQHKLFYDMYPILTCLPIVLTFNQNVTILIFLAASKYRAAKT
jgi:hypothetical protein